MLRIFKIVLLIIAIIIGWEMSSPSFNKPQPPFQVYPVSHGLPDLTPVPPKDLMAKSLEKNPIVVQPIVPKLGPFAGVKVVMLNVGQLDQLSVVNDIVEYWIAKNVNVNNAVTLRLAIKKQGYITQSDVNALKKMSTADAALTSDQKNILMIYFPQLLQANLDAEVFKKPLVDFISNLKSGKKVMIVGAFEELPAAGMGIQVNPHPRSYSTAVTTVYAF